MIQEKSQTIVIERELFYKKILRNPLASASADFIASVLSILLLFIIAIRPTILTIQKIQLKIDELNSFNQKLLIKISTLEKLTPEFQQGKQAIDLVNQAIPDKHNFPVFEKQLRYLIQRNNLSPLSITFSKFPLIENQNSSSDDSTAKLEKDYENGKISFSLTATGSYDEIKIFISQIQSLIRIVSLDLIVIENSNQGDGKGDLLLKVNGKIYFNDGLKTDLKND